ncbi:MAG: nucleoside hydrolase [Candidatus Freyarchaeota archaeon]
MRRIILDTDVGLDVDDAYAISLAARSPELSLEGVTTVYGDAQLRARIAVKLLKLAGGGNVPVLAGEGEPITKDRQALMLGFEGEGILTPEDRKVRVSGGAVDFTTSKALASERNLTIVAIGPLTNVAKAIVREPGFTDCVEELVVMGGVINPPEIEGKRVPFEYEYNFNCDPEATRIVFESGIPITLVPVDITMKPENHLTENELERLREADTPLTRTLLEMTRVWLKHYGELAPILGLTPEMVKPWMHDPLTVTVTLREKIFRIERVNLRIDTSEGTARVVLDEGGAEIRVCKDADFQIFKKLLIERLTKI